MNSFKADKIGQLFPSGDDMGYPIIKYMAKYYLGHFKGMFTAAGRNCVKLSWSVQGQLISD